ncbi:MAG: hypothetical protein MK137_02780 [Rickettsiales bacterium]|nr:hypothetical protein [Rickettsiales bacterium]
MSESTAPIHNMSKKDLIALVTLSIAIIGMIWGLLPMALEPKSEPKTSEEVVVDIAKSLVNVAKGVKEAPPPPKEKTFVDAIADTSPTGSLVIAAATFITSIIVYVFGANKRLFSATIAVNIVTVAVQIFWIAVCIALIFAAIRFLEVVGIDFFN